MDSDIRYIKHDQIDKTLWNQRIQEAANGMIYAHTEYLDAMSPDWDALVVGNYEAIMPITWRKKLGIKYVCQPAFSQQLGVFYIDEKFQHFVPDFLRKLSIKFRLIEIAVNHQNPISNASVHNNFVLSLKENYALISAGYKKELSRNISRTAKYNMHYNIADDVELAINSFRQQYNDRFFIRDQDYQRFIDLSKRLRKSGNVIVRQVSLENGELLAISLFLKDSKRIYNVAPTTFPNGRTLGANHFLMDELIKEFSGSNLLLDFEGSDLPGVARFYQKFGPVNQPYYFWKSNRLPAVLRWWKK